MGEQLKQDQPQGRPQHQTQERYSEPPLLKHEPVRDNTGFKYGEKTGTEHPC